MAGRFKRGYDQLADESKKQEARRASQKERLPEFYLKDDKDEADVRFLLEEPYQVRMHQVKKKSKSGKAYFDTVVCPQDKTCPFCKNGDNPTLKGVNLVLDRRPYTYTDGEGKEKTQKQSVKLYIQGTKTMGILERLSNKYGLTEMDVTIVRLGTGTSTAYTIERGDKSPVSEKEIRKALPEWCRDKYDGTEESLDEILQEQLEKRLASADTYTEDFDEEDDDDDDGSTQSAFRSRRNRYVEDDDDDNDEIEGDDEEVDETPKKSSRLGRKISSGKSKRRLR